MTQEEKQLLIKDLCARLPYGVIIAFSKDEDLKNLKIKSAKLLDILCENIENVYINTESVAYLNIEYVQPYLRPMSSMTEKEKKEHDFYCGYKPYDENIGEWYLTEYDMPDYIDFLYEHHLDFRGLIPMGLALEAPDGMYKNE